MQNIVSCGIPRSGSTLVWQILQALFPRKTIGKYHPLDWTFTQSFAIVSIRDPRDVVASLYRVGLSRAGKAEGDKTDVDNAIRWAARNFLALTHIKPKWHSVVRYEEFYNNHAVIYDAIEKLVGTTIPEKARKRISRNCSIRANMQRASRLKDFNEHDEMHIHGDHIGRVTPGYWREELPEWSHADIEKGCRVAVGRWSYA